MLEGTITAIVTPFQSDGSLRPAVDYDAYANLLEWQLEVGVNGIVVCGTTGESATLSAEEKLALIKATCEVVAGKVPVVAGTGCNDTAETLEMTKAAKDLGVDAALVVSPYYNKPTQEGLYQHFKLVAEEGGLPVVIYNIPGRTAVSISLETFERLVKLEQVVAVKQAVDSASELLALSCAVGDKVSILAGDDALTYFTLTVGGKGVISASASAIPAEMLAITSNALAGYFEKAKEAQATALPKIQSLFLETNPAPAKAALKMLGKIPSDVVRLPLVSVRESTREALKREIVN